MKKVVITGAGKGIGAAIARKFASEGHEVAVCARTGKDLDEMAAEFSKPGGKSLILPFTADVSKTDQIETFFRFVTQEMGHVDILVNNAGIFIPGQIHKEEPGVLEKTIETNLYSAYRFTRLFVPGMIEKKGGHIFNICSTASIMGYVNGGSYCISKFALYGMSKVLREEMKPYNIKVTSVLPGATLTHSWEGTELPPERFMEPEDVAEMVYAASSLSSSAVVEDILLRPLEGDI